MKCDYLEKRERDNQDRMKNSMLVTVGDIVVQLVFADKKNGEVPEIVGNILRGAYLQHQSV